MFGVAIPEGALFYAATKKRQRVAFDAELRTLTIRVAAEVRANIADAHTPPPVVKPGCKRCSLLDHCRPARLEKPPSVQRWLERQVAAMTQEA